MLPMAGRWVAEPGAASWSERPSTPSRSRRLASRAWSVRYRPRSPRWEHTIVSTLLRRGSALSAWNVTAMGADGQLVARLTAIFAESRPSAHDVDYGSRVMRPSPGVPAAADVSGGGRGSVAGTPLAGHVVRARSHPAGGDRELLRGSPGRPAVSRRGRGPAAPRNRERRARWIHQRAASALDGRRSAGRRQPSINRADRMTG